MKKNDTMGYVVYALMLITAVLVGLLVLQPEFGSDAAKTLTMHPVVIVLVAIVIAIILTGVLIEAGHLLGAKIGKYDVSSSVALGIGFKKDKEGKKKFFFGNFDGITGETIIVPKDVKKSNPHPFIYFPLLFVLVEIIAFVVLVVIAGSNINKGDPSLFWLKVGGETGITIACMIVLYQIFPFALDAKNDGYLLTILNSKANVEAYNEMLIADDRASKGLEPLPTPVYDDVTDFTVVVNDITLYADFAKKDYDGALAVLEKTIASKKHVSPSVYKSAEANKLAIIIKTKPLAESKKYFIALPIEIKKFMAGLTTIAAVRSYILANGLIEESVSETEAALEKAPDVLRKLPKERKAQEKAMIKEDVELVMKAHPDWDLSDYGYGEKKPALGVNGEAEEANQPVITGKTAEFVDKKEEKAPEAPKEASSEPKDEKTDK